MPQYLPQTYSAVPANGVFGATPVGGGGTTSTTPQLILCPILQKSLYDLAQQDVGLFYRHQTGFLDSLMSAKNTQSFTATPSYNSNGGPRRIDYIYNPAFAITGAGAPVIDGDPVLNGQDSTSICDGTPLQMNLNVQTVSPDTFASITSPILKFTLSEMNAFCFEDNSQYRANLMAGLMNSIITSIDSDLITQFYNGAPNNYMFATPGAFYGTPVPTALQVTLVTGSQQPNYIGWSNVKYAFKQIGYMGNPIIVGAGDPGIGVQTYADAAGIGCCNDWGMDIGSNKAQMDYYFDMYMDTNSTPIAAGGNVFLGYQPGTLQFLYWNENMGASAMSSPNNFERGTIIDPITGIPFDIFIKFIDCPPTNQSPYWAIQLSLKYALWGLPPNLYPVGHPLENVTHNLSFQAIP